MGCYEETASVEFQFIGNKYPPTPMDPRAAASRPLDHRVVHKAGR